MQCGRLQGGGHASTNCPTVRAIAIAGSHGALIWQTEPMMVPRQNFNRLLEGHSMETEGLNHDAIQSEQLLRAST
jgi:hypothetical protein